MNHTNEKLQRLRKEYTAAGLSKADVVEDPFAQFELWLDAAVAAELIEPNGMTLATSSADGRPSARVVLLKAYDRRGFVFYTNYESRKGGELLDNPYAALAFWWGPLERQIRIEGKVERLDPAESDAYYSRRPRGSRIGAWASPQSEVVANRELLNRKHAEFEAKFGPDADIARPPFWGGYRVVPDHFEFWQGRQNRLHDRVVYRLESTGMWTIARLAP